MTSIPGFADLSGKFGESNTLQPRSETLMNLSDRRSDRAERLYLAVGTHPLGKFHAFRQADRALKNLEQLGESQILWRHGKPVAALGAPNRFHNPVAR